MVNKPKDKGRRKEHQTIAFLEKYGFACKRLGGYCKIDVQAWNSTMSEDEPIPTPNAIIDIQVKARKTEPTTIVRWLDGVDMLTIWGDRSQDPLVVMRGSKLMELMGRERIGQPPAGEGEAE